MSACRCKMRFAVEAGANKGDRAGRPPFRLFGLGAAGDFKVRPAAHACVTASAANRDRFAKTARQLAATIVKPTASFREAAMITSSKNDSARLQADRPHPTFAAD